ncbi:TetR family transcriptional regulator [Pseudonocardia sulfidoxydans NBRC 16205]|uniref:TetR family transcriptional regulator n=1 Tax=Pseudonocardia sulfidoxydans NBRC 16205 TaxID=1223511 RepID=A0A511DLS8_9PSEU|nr:TetR/AcrR family transcriptional regulator [Pseudonocardia sulfidoxydans]GEL25765.1 TetR family transcriptional regulator [Pseudonocardia sulfidoxydans NBRC 16205]
MADPQPVVWMRPENGTRGPRPSHTRGDLAAAAVRVADAEGLDAVSMRRVAAELGVGTTTLYRYVGSKDDVLELMADEVVGELRSTALRGPWRDDLAVVARALRGLVLHHPWYAAVASSRTTLGPHHLWWSETSLSALDGLDLDPDAMLATLQTVASFVLGHVLGELADAEAARRTGLSHDDWMARQAEYGRTIMADPRYPRLTRIMADAAAPHAPDRADRVFEAGLTRVLDGVDANLPRGGSVEGPGT